MADRPADDPTASDPQPDGRSDNRADVRDFLTSRRARLTPAEVGLAPGGRRRVPGLRREEVALLAGVSTDWYARLEKGHITGVSEDVLEAVARALRLDDTERTYLFDLARAARPASRPARRPKRVEVPPDVPWMLDAMTMSAAFVTDGRMDLLATNALARAMYAPMFASALTAEHGRANLARFHFLDPSAHEFYADRDAALRTTVALLRAEAGRFPRDRALRELVGELSTLSNEFRTLWAAHDVQIRHHGVKRFRHPQVGPLELHYRALDLPASPPARHTLTIYTPEPGTEAEERFRLLASLAATDAATDAATSDAVDDTR